MKQQNIKIIFSILFILSMVSCREKLSYDKNGILLYENLNPQTEEYWDVLHSSLWIPVKKSRGPYMFLGEEKYSGKIVKYFQNGNLEFEGNYFEGSEKGEWKHYFENGTIKSIHIINAETYNRYYNEKEFYKNGKLKSHFIGDSYRDTTYYLGNFKNGSLKYEHLFSNYHNRIEKYERRKFNGEVYEYLDEDSIFYKKDRITLNVLEQGQYLNGRKTGTWYKYSESNKLLWLKNYSDNWLHGSFEEYYDSGTIKLKGEYVDGYKDGLWKEHYASGMVKEKGEYVNGDKIGPWKEYYENGKKKKVANFKKGKLEGIYKEYYKNGKLKEQREYYANDPYGVWIYYKENGKIERKENHD